MDQRAAGGEIVGGRACRGGADEAVAVVVGDEFAVGGDFGGKGLIGEIPLCVGLARLVRRPVKLALRYSEDLAATSPRHSMALRVRVGCDQVGRLQALRVDAVVDGGAYAGFKPRANVDLSGLVDAGSPYRIPAVYSEARIAYTNSVPRGHMRAPGAPQATFAVESALDELALEAGLPPVELRRRNLLGDGEPNIHGVTWAQCRALETLDAALGAASSSCPAPAGWLTGTGIGVYDRRTTRAARTSLRLVAEADGGVRAEVAVPETGTGSHTVARRILADALGLPDEAVRVVHVPTHQLPYDRGAGGSRGQAPAPPCRRSRSPSASSARTSRRTVTSEVWTTRASSRSDTAPFARTISRIN